MKTNERLILECKAWSKEKRLADKNYFKRLTKMNGPGILWIGSSDSLFSVREITNTEPGEILLYQNVANQVSHEDPSFMAMLEQALISAKIELIIVCGYGKCRGVMEVLREADDKPFVKRWLSGLNAIYYEHKEELDRLPMDKREKKLSELNIQRQITNLSEINIIRNSWEQRSAPVLLGWYFDLPEGEMKEVIRLEPHRQPEEISMYGQ
ncbi:MAG TPA: carbonic anhydrase [Cyclobacteriaceae bacterium]|nr:carbonic anhydrase [Cyclobacteriaceae bacterium]